jgi:hypothetical protein
LPVRVSSIAVGAGRAGQSLALRFRRLGTRTRTLSGRALQQRSGTDCILRSRRNSFMGCHCVEPTVSGYKLGGEFSSTLCRVGQHRDCVAFETCECSCHADTYEAIRAKHLARIEYAVLEWQDANEVAARARNRIISVTNDAAGYVSYDEVGDLMGVSRQRISQLMRANGHRRRARRKS